ncbi:hypothetical protein K470DRAFT_198643, partial [Piedraia hortae CBS 480.64]
KYYAVRVGRVPGIYETWEECAAQTKGFPKATFKSFGTLNEAEEFVKVKDAAEKWYAVQRGRRPGVYKNWGEVLEQITGFKNSSHCAFPTKVEAELFLRGTREATEDAEEGPRSKKAKLDEYPPGEAPLSTGASGELDANILLDPRSGGLRYKTGAELTRTKLAVTRPTVFAPVRIYTDGASLANGRAGAVAGVGVYFGPSDKRNISEGLAGPKQTNQRAELTAISKALEFSPKDRKLVILSDSMYSIKCVTEWCFKWRQNGWIGSLGKPVENKDLIQKIISQLEERLRINEGRQVAYENGTGPWERGPAGVRFEWVKGHNKDEGNEAADMLATAGARDARDL